jgi:methionyl-tRNA formyltransferase
MRILCCLNRDLASNLALNLLLPELLGHEVWVGLTERVGSTLPDEEPQRRELRTVEQVLPNQILFPLLERLPELGDCAGHLTFSQIQSRHHIRVEALPNPNHGTGLSQVQAFAPDLILSIRYGAIFKAPVLSIPQHGILNLHSGLLPYYRGVLATFRALMKGDTEIGCTLHYIRDPTIDTGDIVSSTRLTVQPQRSLLWHILALYPDGIEMMRRALGALHRGDQLPTQQQRYEEGAYYSYPNVQEWNEFYRRGWRVADPSDLEQAFRRYLPSAAMS